MEVEGFAAARDLVEPLLAESAKLCEEVLFPLNAVGDRQGLKYKDGTVTTPEGFKEAYKAYVEGGWPTLTWPTEFGGQGMPEFLNMNEMGMSTGRLQQRPERPTKKSSKAIWYPLTW